MALKDWEKVTGNDGDIIISYKRKGIFGMQLYVSKAFNEYIFSVSEGLSYRADDTRNFKSKSQALKFAKSYMRTH